MMRRLISIAILALCCGLLSAQQTDSSRIASKLPKGLEITDSYLDTVSISKNRWINDYSMIGIQYGAGLNFMIWNPTRSQKMPFSPYNFGIMYSRYGKMFGYMPYFGFQIGLFYGQDGYQFKKDDDEAWGSYNTTAGSDKITMTCLEMPFLAHCHMDFWKMKIIVNLGYYLGYRLSIQRSEPYSDIYLPYQNKFITETDPTIGLVKEYRFDYGLKGGVGLGFVFDPIEIHLQATYKQSLRHFADPDYRGDGYYFRNGFPAGVVVSCGIHYQITRRQGKTNKELRQAAYDAVYNPEKAEPSK